MKRFLALFLIICMLFSLAACKGGNTENSDAVSSDVSQVVSQEASSETSSEVSSEEVSSEDVSSDEEQASSPAESSEPIEESSEPNEEGSEPDEESSEPNEESSEPSGESSEPNEDSSDSDETSSEEDSSDSVHTHSFTDATCTEPQTCTGCGVTEGEPMGHAYVVGECSVCGDYDSAYCPKLYFQGNMTAMNDKKDVRNISFEYRSKEQIVTGSAKIKVQGSSSLAYAKKNYTINFYEDSTFEEKRGVDVGWGPQNEYCLKANWIDKTHSRNIVTAKLAGEVQRKYGLLDSAPNNGAIDGFPIEVYINGEFHGLYTMNIPKDAWLLGMDEDNPNHIAVCGDNWTDPVLFNAIPTDFSGWELEIGEENDETLAKLQRLVSFVKDSSDEEFKANFEQYLNLDSTLNYYIMINYCWMPDNVGKNMILATYDGEVWYPSLYDLDTTWGPSWTGTELNNYKDNLMWVANSVLWSRMETLFKREIASRYFELRETILTPEHIMDLFNNFYNSIPGEVLDRETEKWDTEETPIPGYPLSQIQDYLDSVTSRYDTRYNRLR